MSRRIVSLVMFGLICQMSIAARAGDIVADGAVESQGTGFKFPDGSVQASAANEPRTEIDSVPLIITQSGSYFFGGNLAHGAAGDAITIDADDVTLDLMGFALDGTGSSGNGIVLTADRSSIEIRNGTVRNFALDGIVSTGDSKAIAVIGIRSIGNTGTGIDISGTFSTGHQIRHCIVLENGVDGIDTKHTRVADVQARDNGGTGIDAGTSSLVVSSAASGNGEHGINVSTGSSVIDSASVDNQLTGIRGGGGSILIANNTLSNNNKSHSTSDASIRVSNKTLVRGNTMQTVFGLGTDAGVLVTGERNAIERNLITGHDTGILFDGTAGDNLTVSNYLSGNTVAVTNNGMGTITAVSNSVF